MQTKAFLSWCASQGVTTPLKLQGTDSYRYMACETDLTGNIIKAPIKVRETRGSAEGTVEILSNWCNRCELTKSFILSTFLFYEKSCLTADTPEALAEILAHERSLGSKSKYKPWLDILPTIDGQLGSMPCFWDPKRFEHITDGGQLQQKVLRDERKDIDPWALACVSSRVNFLDDFSLSMTPLLDMLNHDPEVGTKAKIKDGELSLDVDKTFKAGEEVFISYGELTNLETLCDYGFISKNNPCNAETIDVRVIRRPPLPVPVYADGSISNDSLKVLRSYLATEEEIEGEQEQAELLAFSKPVSKRNEEEVIALLSVTLDDAVDAAKFGAENVVDDEVVLTYLSARAETLKTGLKIVEKKLEHML